jgi:predicted GTPase
MSIISGKLDSSYLEEDHGESASAMSPTVQESSVTESIAANTQGQEEGVSDDELRLQMEAWKEAAKDRPLRVLICGLGGVGKSTLINHLLQLKPDEKWAEEGRRGGATTSIVSKFERTTKRGIKVCLFDTPGFDDVDMSNEEVIAMMEIETEKTLDMVFYCISLDGPARVQRSDMQAFEIITQAFSSEIWTKAVIVLTFANELEKKKDSEIKYKETTTSIQEKVQQVLKKNAHVTEEIIDRLPIVTAGYTEPILKYEAEECRAVGGWNNRLFLTALKQVEPKALPTLFEARWSWKDLGVALAGGGSGAAATSSVGAIAGALCGAPLGPLGAGVGAIIGGAIGGGVGLLGGAGVGLLIFNLMKIKSIIKIKYKRWQLKRKQNPRQ